MSDKPKIEVTLVGEDQSTAIEREQQVQAQAREEQEQREEAHEQAKAEAEGGNAGGEPEGKTEGNETPKGDQEPTGEEVSTEDETPKADEKPLEITEDNVLSFLKKQGLELESIEDLKKTPEPKEVELPDDVAAFAKYVQDTGRGLADYMKLNQDFDSMDDDALLASYFIATEAGVDSAEDAKILLADYAIDEEVMDDQEIGRMRLKKKRMIAKAKEHFEAEKSKYVKPVERTGSSTLSEEQQKNIEAALEIIKSNDESAKTREQNAQEFLKATESVLNSDFKGFEVKVGDDASVVFNPAPVEQLIERQVDLSGFMSKFMDESGKLTDVEGYHKALAIAMNPEQFAKLVWEQAVSTTLKEEAKEERQIDMTSQGSKRKHNHKGIEVTVVKNPH